MNNISLPTHVDGERVVALFPIIGGNSGFVEADIVTTDGDENQPATRFTVRHFRPNHETITRDESYRSFPEAIREARKSAGWG